MTCYLCKKQADHICTICHKPVCSEHGQYTEELKESHGLLLIKCPAHQATLLKSYEDISPMTQESSISPAYQQAVIQSAGEIAVKKRIEELKKAGTLKTLEDLKQEQVLSELFTYREAAMVVISAVMRAKAQGLPEETARLFIKRFQATLQDKRCPHCGAYFSYVDFARIPGEDWYGAYIQPCNHRLYQQQGGQG